MSLLLLLSACVKAPSPVVPPVPPAPPAPLPSLNKTFGDATYRGGASLLLHYKDMTVLVDPALGNSVGLDPASLSSVDYLLLTDLQPNHFGAAAQQALRKTTKLIAPKDAGLLLKTKGFSQVKELTAGSRLLLKKGDHFLFVSAMPVFSPELHQWINSYLLEFDNGRNLLVLGQQTDMDALRSFLYQLRDDGKDVHLAFLSGVEKNTAEIIGLFQPQLAAVETETPLSPESEAQLRQGLKDQMFEGNLRLVRPGEPLVF